MAEDMSTEYTAPQGHEDSLNGVGPVSKPNIAVDKTLSGQCDDISLHPDGVVNEDLKMDAEANQDLEKIATGAETAVHSTSIPENPLGDDAVMEALPDNRSEPTTETVGVAGVAVVEVTDAQESLGHDVIDKSMESSLRACSSVERQPTTDLSEPDMSKNLDPVEANTVRDDAITHVITVHSELNVDKASDAVVSHEMNEELLAKEDKQDELTGLADGDGSAVHDEPLPITLAWTETSEKETQHAPLKQPDSNFNSSEAKKDGVFSFGLPNTSDRDTNKAWQPFSTPPVSAISGTVESSAVVTSLTSERKKRPRKTQGLKESSEPKRRRSTAQKGGKKGNQHDEAALSNHLDREERPVNSLTPIGSSLSTLSFSSSHPEAFQQPFTDFQQLQLRAQIFVYGSLIQGSAPDEACLISAFGGPDGGRSIWEKPWRKCLERIHNQISRTNMKSPVLQNSGNPTLDKKSKKKVNASPLGSAGKSDLSHAVSPMIPLSSPLWNIHTSASDGLQVSGITPAPTAGYNPLPPLYPWQSPTKNMGYATSWSSHPSPLQWVASAQTSPWDPNISSSVFPCPESVKLIPVKDSSLKPYSTADNSSADLSLSNVAGSATSSDLDVMGTNPASRPLDQMIKNTKLDKGKKVSVLDKSRQDLELASHSSKTVLAIPSDSIQPASVKGTPLSATNVSATSTTATLSRGRVFIEDIDAAKTNVPSEDTISRVNEAKLQAEEAATFAEAAISHSQQVWDQLDGKNSSLESKVASAASAIAAAALVAKAAAAAAKLASEAALQAKLMVEESFSDECIKVGSVNGMTFCEGANLVGGVTPVSILKGENRTSNSTSIISAAKEAARRKIESAVAASKHAENLDAIVKAAELAAEAVAQAGKVVAMGDPEGYWKLSQESPEQFVVSTSVKEVSFNNEANDDKGSSFKIPQDGMFDHGSSQHAKSGKPDDPPTSSLGAFDAQMTTVGNVSGSITNEDLTAKDVVPSESVDEMKSPSLSSLQESGKMLDVAADNHVEKGSIVEVFKEWGTVKAAWFAARVLDLKDEDIYVSYIEKIGGDGQHKEWITLSREGNTAPTVRIAHPVTIIPSDGGRKRRRSAIGSHSWEVGDKVDAWMQDCWWEGMIIEKNVKDASSLTVQFPAQGEKCVVKAWNLRPSLIWKDGAWVQCSSPNDHMDDVHRGKRQKYNSPQMDAKGESKSVESSGDVNLKLHDSSCLMGLSEHEKNFNVGISTRDDAKIYEKRMVRTGLQKEGSKIIFGIPKPGKKKKFMDVSKHFDGGGKTKVIKSNDPYKTSRLPISRGPYGWKKSNSRTESQQKASQSKPKDASVVSAASDVDEDRKMDHTAGDSGASGTERQAEPESCSNTDEAIDDSILISTLARPSRDPSSKRPGLGNIKSERAGRGKHGLSHAKKAGAEGDKVASGKTQQEASETRRSNRRIQPTSRLLEGLQTSLSLAKVSSTVNRSIKSHNKN